MDPTNRMQRGFQDYVLELVKSTSAVTVGVCPECDSVMSHPAALFRRGRRVRNEHLGSRAAIRLDSSGVHQPERVKIPGETSHAIAVKGAIEKDGTAQRHISAAGTKAGFVNHRITIDLFWTF